MTLPQAALAGPGNGSPSATQQVPAIVDVELAQGGVLSGQVVDAAGTQLAGTPVTVWQKDRQIASSTTSDDGRFAVRGLKGGLYQVTAGQGGGVFRCWANRTAPPVAQRQAMIVSGTVVRGQDGSVVRFLTNPWVLAGLVGAAIAIPIALSNNDDDGS